jgi:hypothetical protein
MTPQTIIHGVSVVVGSELSTFYPCGDRDGSRRPQITVPQDCTPAALFKTICEVRGRYDLDREFEGFDPFQWGPCGNYSDTLKALEAL